MIQIEASDYEKLVNERDALKAEAAELRQKLEVEKLSWKRIKLDDPVRPVGGRRFIVWHSADGLEQLEFFPKGIDWMKDQVKRPIRRAIIGPCDARLNASALSLGDYERSYELRDIQCIYRDGWGNVQAEVAHYHEMSQNRTA